MAGPDDCLTTDCLSDAELTSLLKVASPVTNAIASWPISIDAPTAGWCWPSPRNTSKPRLRRDALVGIRCRFVWRLSLSSLPSWVLCSGRSTVDDPY